MSFHYTTRSMGYKNRCISLYKGGKSVIFVRKTVICYSQRTQPYLVSWYERNACMQSAASLLMVERRLTCPSAPPILTRGSTYRFFTSSETQYESGWATSEWKTFVMPRNVRNSFEN